MFMSNKNKIPHVSMDCSVIISNSKSIHSNLYKAFIIAYNRTPSNESWTISEPLYEILEKNPNLYVDKIDDKYYLFLCSHYSGLFPRIYLGDFVDPWDLKEAIKFMEQSFDRERIIQYSEDCV